MANRYPIQIPNTPTFDVNDNSTRQEQEDVFNNPSLDTGIVDHGYSGTDEGVADPNYQGALVVGNQGSLVIAPNQISSGSDVQAVKLSGGQNVQISSSDSVLAANELVVGGLGSSPNVLLNLPSSDGTYRGRPVWNYSAMEGIDALKAYQANRARLIDPLADIVESGEYDFFIIAIPANADNANIHWKDTFRAQLHVPPESLLVMILADSPNVGGPPS